MVGAELWLGRVSDEMYFAAARLHTSDIQREEKYEELRLMCKWCVTELAICTWISQKWAQQSPCSLRRLFHVQRLRHGLAQTGPPRDGADREQGKTTMHQ